MNKGDILVTYTGGEYLANIGLPIFLLVISIWSFIWFAREVKKGRLEFKSMASWFTLNIMYTITIIYILIVTSLQIAGYEGAVNIFDWIAKFAFGFELDRGKQYVFTLIFIFIAYILIRSLRNSIKIANLQLKVDALNKEVAVLSGKISKTIKPKKLDRTTTIKKDTKKKVQKKKK